MNEIIIGNGKDINLSTVEIAELTGKRHDNVLRDTKAMLTELCGAKGLLRFEGAYSDAQGKERPCYRLPKTELLVLISGYSIPLRAKIIRRLEQLENLNHNNRLPESKKEAYELELLTIESCARMLNYSEPSRLELLHAVAQNNGVSTAALPEFTPAVRVTFSASDLLKKNGCNLSAMAFNKLMLANGLMEEKERTASKGRIKKFKVLTEAGLEYGQNDASRHNPRQAQVHYFEDTFMKLYDMITREVEVA